MSEQANEAVTVAGLLQRIVDIADKATKTQDAIEKRQRRNTRNTRLLIASVALDIGLSIATIVLAVGQVSTSSAIHQSQLNGCAIGNNLRVRQITLWDHVLTIAGPPARETPAERRRRLATDRAFRLYVRAQFRPVDCAKLYRQ